MQFLKDHQVLAVVVLILFSLLCLLATRLPSFKNRTKVLYSLAATSAIGIWFFVSAELAGIVVAFLALLIGILHVKEIRNVLNAAQSQLVELQNIKESLSTRYIWLFPEYYPEIAELMELARKEIIILCDFPGYGSFSDRITWIRYSHALESKTAGGVNIKITCFDEELRGQILADQFFSPNVVWENWKEIPSNKKRLEDLLKYHRGETFEGLTRDRFLKILEGEEISALTGAFANADITLIRDSTPFYFWLIDGRRAIFAIASLGEKEYGFSTTDQKLITAFLEMRGRHLKEAAPSPISAADTPPV